jgi:phage terminase large subunit GpA-like protein
VDAEPFNPDTKDETPPDWTAIYNRREDYATDTKILMPEGALVLVAGVDVQPDRLEVHKGCYGRKQEYWAVEHVVIPGDIKRSETWEALEQELLRTYDSAIAPNAKLALSFALVDAGHGADHLLWWLAALQKKGSPLCGRVRACRGSSQYPHPVVDNRYSKIVKQLHGHWVGGDEAKSLIYTRLRMEEKEEGYRHYGMNHDEKFFQQLTVEKATVEFKKGEEHRRFRNEEHARNEALDCSVYEMAAFRLRQWNFDALEAKMREELEPRPSEPAQIKQAPRVSFIPQTAGAWI